MYNNQPNGYYGGRAPKRLTVSGLFRDPEFRFNRLLFFTGNVIGLGVVGYLAMSFMFSLMLKMNGRIYGLYDGDLAYRYLLEILYSFFCVGAPFLIVYIILKNKSGIDDLRVPLGKAFPGADMYLLIPAGLGVCFIGSVLTNYFAAWADSNGFGFNSYYEALNDPGAPDGVAGVIILILHSAVVPAIVEELAFRGVVMQTLRKFGDVFAIVSSAVLFGLIHANMTQVPFAIVAGIALGYCATVTGTLRTSITVHFLNNFVSVMVTLISRYFGDTPATVFSSVAMYGFIIIGLIAFAVYALRHPYLTRLRPGRFGAVQKKAACFFLAPVMAAAILWVAWYIILDVSPVYDFFNPV